MDFFYISTYRNDYRWPCTKKYQNQENQNSETVAPPKADTPLGIPCSCGLGTDKTTTVRQNGMDSLEWSRIGPMGQLFDPKLHPAKDRFGPEIGSYTTVQSNIHPKELGEACPNVYDVLQSAGADIAKRIEKDRLKTTYQVDYCEPSENRMTDHSNAVKSDRGDQYQSSIRLRCEEHKLNKEATKICLKNDKCRNLNGKREKEIKGPNTIIPTWKTEYRDVIGKTGSAIIKGQLDEHNGLHKGNRMILNMNICT